MSAVLTKINLETDKGSATVYVDEANFDLLLSILDDAISDDIGQKQLIAKCLHEVSHLAGDIVEIGVHRGDSAQYICELSRGTMVYLFDTFTGFPESMVTHGLDSHHAGNFDDTSADRVRELLAGHNVQIIEGIFPESATISPRIKFAHIDVDLYKSTKAALEWCWPLLVPGGVILDDDYGCGSCVGAKKAVDEFVKRTGAVCELEGIRAIIRRGEDAD